MPAPFDPPTIATVHVPACIVCGAEGRPFLGAMRDRHFGVPGAWGFSSCERCDHVWLDPSPAPHELDRLYRTYYTHAPAGSDEGGRAGAAAAVSRRRALRNALLNRLLGYDLPSSRGARSLARVAAHVGPVRRFVELIPLGLGAPPGSVLDAGAGDGAFLAKMASLGWRVQGLEPDAQAAAGARRAHGFDVVEGRLESNTLDAASFDAVTMSHVIEHVFDPFEAMVGALRLLRPGGTLVIVTPNTRSLGARMFGPHWVGWEPPRHLHLFTPSTLEQITRRAGFRVSRVLTSGRGATYFTSLSRQIADQGVAPGQQPRLSATDRLAGAALALAEESRPRRQRGEEIILMAARPG